MAKILLTGSKKVSTQATKILQEKNHQIIIQPLFSIQKKSDLYLEISDYKNLQAVLITSPNAVFALEKLVIKKDNLILTVGEKTAKKVKKLGYKNVISANNSAASLLDLALEKLSKNKGVTIYLSGEIITLDLAEKLNEKGFMAKRMIVYKTMEIENFSDKTIDKIRQGDISEVWLYSKNSVIIFHKLAKKHNLLECLDKIKILCLSWKIANFAGEFFSTTGIIEE